MKGKFIYSMILFAGLLFAGSDFLYAQTQSGSSNQQKSYNGKSKHSKKSSKKNQENMNKMQDTTKNYQYKSSEGKDYRDMQDNQIQDTSKWRNQDRYKGMSDSSKLRQYHQKGGINQDGYQNQGDYSNPSGVNRDKDYVDPEGIDRQGDIQNEGDIQHEDRYAPMKDTTKGSNYYDKKSKDWNNDKDMRLEKNEDLNKKNR
jgi:hypothetical protein